MIGNKEQAEAQRLALEQEQERYQEEGRVMVWVNPTTENERAIMSAVAESLTAEGINLELVNFPLLVSLKPYQTLETHIALKIIGNNQPSITRFWEVVKNTRTQIGERMVIGSDPIDEKKLSVGISEALMSPQHNDQDVQILSSMLSRRL